MSIHSRDPVIELSESEALPHLDARAGAALNRLYAGTPQLRMNARVSARDVAYQLRWAFDASACAAPETYRFKLGTQHGVLGLDATSHAELLGERRPHLLPRELRYILMAEALHPLAEMLEKAWRQPFEWVPPHPNTPAAASDMQSAAHFRAMPIDAPEAISLRGYVQFDDAGHLDALAPPLPAPEPGGALKGWLAGLRVPLSFCLGSTQIRLRDLGGISRGDIIGIEEWGSSGSAIVVTATVGGPHGRHLWGLADGSRITLQNAPERSKDTAMNRDTPPPSSLPEDLHATANLPIDRLDALEVSLRFEVGDLSVSLGELKALRAGHVFDLGQPLNRGVVRILAHGNVLGKGFLVAVGDRLGVRVSEFAPNEV
jgi:type III secretion protein Q